MLSSFIHNFFDGLAIGIGFASKDKAVYIPIIVAIFAHEIPREMGDVGVMMKSGFSNVQTVLCNGFINCVSLVGVFLGLGLGSINETVESYIMVWVAGNFVYIAADIWKHLLKNKNRWLNFFEFAAFSLGVGIMYIVLLAEGDGEHGHESE